MDYKATLNMPKTDFEMKAGLATKEPKILADWLKNDIYQKRLEQNKNKPLFFLHDGPPYANGNLHVGHALNMVLKDIIVRYKNFAGYYSPFIPGWDTHGLPIELAVLKQDSKNKFLPVVEIRNKCAEYAKSQIAIQKNQFLRMGTLSNFEKIYVTLDSDFETKELELFKDLVAKKLVYQDFKPVYWSWSSQSALAEAEIEYGDQESDSIYVTWDVVKGNQFVSENDKLVIWTTTPWTIPANKAIAVNPEFEYCLIKANNKNYVVGKDLIDEIAKVANWTNYEIVNTFKGIELDKVLYVHPLTKEICPVILADYVGKDNGTGLVHNAPGFGNEDYIACKKYNIPPFSPVDAFGKYTNEIYDKDLVGTFYADANPIIIERLSNAGNLLAQNKIVHSVAHDWRTHKPVIYRATRQWFVNIKEIQNDIVKTLENDVKSPNPKATSRMKEMILNRSEWCISRQRVWGLPIPIIYNETDEPILDLEVIENTIQLLKENGSNVWWEWPAQKFLTSKYDQSKTYTKETDILDVWFDSGSSHAMFSVWGLDYPADLYLEGTDQYRGWFNSSLITGTISNGKAPYKSLLSHGFVLDEKGFKMSKSKGNTVDPQKVFDEFGADIFRLWVADSNYGADTRIGQNILKQYAEMYRKIRNTLFRFSLGVISDFDYQKDFVSEFRLEDKWVLNYLHNVLIQINESYSKYEFSNVVKLVNKFTYDLSTWYFDMIKGDIYCEDINSPIRKIIQSTIYLVVSNMAIALSPIMPYTTEEVYSFLNKTNKKESIHLENWIELNPFINEKIDDDFFTKFFGLRDKVNLLLEQLRTNNQIKKNTEAKVILPKSLVILDVNTLRKWLGVAIVEISNDNAEIIVENANLPRCERCWEHIQSNQMHDDLCERCFKVLNK